MTFGHRCVELPPEPPRDLLVEHIGDRLHFALAGGVQLSGVVQDVTRRGTDGRGGEVALALVRVVTGDTWQPAALGTTGIERDRVLYWQHVVTVTEPSAQVME